MSIHTLLDCIALAASLILIVRHRPIAVPVIAMVVSAIEVLLAFGLLHLSAGRVPLGLIFGGVLVIAGVIVFVRAHEKPTIATSTVVTLIGALQIVGSLHGTLHVR